MTYNEPIQMKVARFFNFFFSNIGITQVKEIQNTATLKS